jgi:hypothetical protein
VRYLVELPVGDADGSQQIVGVEIDHTVEGPVKVARPGEAVKRAAHSLGEMLAGIRPVAESFVDGFADMAVAPEQIGLEFGLSLSAEAKLVVASSSAAANFKVTLTWHPAPAVESPDPAAPVTQTQGAES